MELSPDGFPRVYCRPIHSKIPIEAFWTGPHDATARKLPLVLYFSLCAEKSLTLSPYNQFVASMSGLPVRVMSISLPEHGRDQPDEEGMMRWAAAWEKEPKIFSNFFENCRALIDQLIACGEVDEKKICLAGLSRGAWIATRLASLSPGVHCVMGLAPLLDLSRVREFAERFDSTRLESEALQLNENLLKSHFFYTIGSHDRRVHTPLCFEWVQKLIEGYKSEGRRFPPVSLHVYPAVGRDGHGTPPEMFVMGARWALAQLGIDSAQKNEEWING